MAWGKKNKQGKKVKVNKVTRPEPKPAAKVAPKVPAKAAPAKDAGLTLDQREAAKVDRASGTAIVSARAVQSKIDKPVNIHMLGSALVGFEQYESGKEYTVSLRRYKEIGTSCVSMAKWRSIQAKGMSNARK